MLRRDLVRAGLSLPFAAAAGSGVRAQGDYPNRPIRLIVPFGAGGSNDHPARIYGERLTAALGQQIVVENKPGASATLGGQMVATAAPDGYTLLCTPTASVVITPHTRKMPYDPLVDLVPVARMSTGPLTVTATNALGVRDMAEFIALAKQNPGKFFFGSSGIGTITHLTGEVFSRAVGIKLQHAPYKTIVDAVGDIMSGRIHMVFDPSFMPQAKAGKLLAALAATKERLTELPNTPTAAEVGLDIANFRDRSWFALFAPKATPRAVIERLSDELGKLAAEPDLQHKLMLVSQAAHHQPHDVFGRQVVEDRLYFANLIKELDLKLE